MRHTIIELAEIPRERDKLKAVIGQARYEMRKSKFFRLTSYAIIGIALGILALNGCSGPEVAAADMHAVFLPILVR
jgi:hypothetical protein